MRKKIVLLLSFVLALTVALGIFTACAPKVEVTLSRTEITVETKKTQTVKATTSTGVEVEWSSSDEAIATVDGGKITGVKAGEAIITASAVKGNGKATCKVTVKDPVVFTFKDEDGNVVKNVTVDRNGKPVKLTATASDGSTVTSWSSEDEKTATVDNNGLITGTHRGETVIYAGTSTGTGSIAVEVEDTFKGENYDISDTYAADKWYYQLKHPDVTEIICNEARYNDEGEHFIGNVTFGFNGGNWGKDNIKLIWANTKAWGAGEPILYFSATIISDFEGVINLNGTRVHLKEGKNEVEVKFSYNNGNRNVCVIEFGTAKDGLIESGTVTISDWGWWEVPKAEIDKPLETPSFTLEGDNVTITDTNKAGVEEYRLGLFKNAADERPAFIQVLSGVNGAIDVTKFEDSGEFFVKVMVVGEPFYGDSAWSEAIAYTVEEHTVEYDVPQGTEADALNGSGWYNYLVDGGSTESVVYNDGKLTLVSGYLGWAFYSTELLCHYPTFDKNTDLLIAMKINASHAGTITLSDTVIELKEGINEVYVKKTQKDGATIVIMFGKYVYNGQNDYGVVDFPLDTELTFEFYDISVTEYKAVNLHPVNAAVADGENKIEVNDKETGVKSYELGFFVGETLMKIIPLNDDGTFSDEALNPGKYTLKIRAIATDVRYVAADWAVVEQEFEVDNGGATYPVVFGGDQDGDTPTGNALTHPNTWYYWNDRNWTGSTTDVSEAEMKKGVLTVAYSVSAGYCDYGIQIYYKDPSITGANKLTLKIKTEEEIDVTINGAKLHLNKGENDVTVYYTQGGSYSFSMQVIVDADAVTENVLEISEIKYEAYTFKTLTAPALAVAEDGTITITDGNAEENVGSYVLGYFTAVAANPLAKLTVKNGETLDYSMVDSGDYILKVMAIAADNKGYKDSGWSAGFDYMIDNPDGAHYDLDTLFGGGDANDNPGRWGVWADPESWTGARVTVSSATFANDEINISFTSAGKSPYGLQINYVNPNYVGGTKYTFDIVATEDMDIQVENGGAEVIRLKAGEKVTLEGGADASFYVQVNIDNNVGGTITISNVKWN